MRESIKKEFERWKSGVEGSDFKIIKGELTQAMFDAGKIHEKLSTEYQTFYTYENSKTEGINILTIFEVDNE